MARHCLLYKIQHGLVDIDSAAYLRQSDSRTKNQSAFFQERNNSDVLLSKDRPVDSFKHAMEHLVFILHAYVLPGQLRSI